MGPGNRRASYPWPFFAAMVASLTLFFGFQTLFSTFPLYITALGGSSSDNGLMVWAFALTAVFTRPLAGRLADRWGRKPVLLAGAVLFAAGPPLYALAPNLHVLLLLRPLHAVGLALFSTAYPPFITDQLPRERYGQGLGLANIASTVALVGGPLFGEWAVGALGFGSAFYLFGLIGGIGVLAVLILPNRAAAPGSPGGGLRAAWAQGGVRTGALVTGLYGLAFGAFLSFVPLLAQERRLGGTGLIFSLFALVSSVLQPLAGRVADHHGGRRVILPGLVILGLAAAGMGMARGWWGLMAASALLGAGGGAVRAGASAIVQRDAAPEIRGSAAALQLTLLDLVISFSVLGLGLLADALGYGVMYAVVGAVTLLGTVAMHRAVSRFSRPV